VRKVKWASALELFAILVKGAGCLLSDFMSAEHREIEMMCLME
jgi:hypothetical protein